MKNFWYLVWQAFQGRAEHNSGLWALAPGSMGSISQSCHLCQLLTHLQNSKNYHLLGIYCILGTIQGILHILIYLLLTKVLLNRFHFIPLYYKQRHWGKGKLRCQNLCHYTLCTLAVRVLFLSTWNRDINSLYLYGFPW